MPGKEIKEEKRTDSVRQAPSKKMPASGTQVFLKIAEIRDDSLVLKNGGIRSVIKVSSINFNLKSEEEQNAIIYSYQSFLNTIDFPVQIVIRSKKLDIDEYLEKLKAKAETQTNDLLKKQTTEYIDYIAKLVEYADIMEKEFFVVVPYDPIRAQTPNLIQQLFANMNPKDTITGQKTRHKEFADLKKKLNARINTVKAGLENCGLQAKELTTKELVAMFYNIYNPVVSRYQKGKNLEEIRYESDEVNIAMDEASQ